MSECSICGRYTFGTERHTCPPAWRCWNPDQQEREDARDVRALTAAEAAEQFVERFEEPEDALRGAIVVAVARNDDAEPRRFRVTTEARLSYDADPVTEDTADWKSA